MMSDKVEIIGNTIIQHGKYNDRIYVMKLAKTDYPGIIYTLNNLATENNYTKIFAKVPSSVKSEFINDDYKEEAFIPLFFNGTEDCYFLSKYFDLDRMIEKNEKEVNSVLTAAKLKAETKEDNKIKSHLPVNRANLNDAAELARFYKKEFKTYPFPIHKTEYIIKSIKSNVDYFFIRENGEIISAASSEKDLSSMNVEMTDFATLPEYRGKGLAYYILKVMEEAMQKEKFIVAYTIARATSYGMNIVFSKNNYKYSGTLVNNTNIYGSLQSMNIWYKYL